LERSRVTEKLKDPKVLAAISVVALALKVLFFTPIFDDALLFDEYYYVTSGRYIFHLLGVIENFTPPIETEVQISNNTIFVNATLHTKVLFLDIFSGTYNWLNLEHPILGKLVIGILILITDSLPAMRTVMLMATLTSIWLLLYVLYKRYGLAVLPGVIVFLLFDWVAVHFMYLGVLDTLMLLSLVVSIAFLFRGNPKLSIAFLSLAAAFKEIAVLFTVPYALYFGFKKTYRYSVYALLLPAIFLAASYGAYMYFTDLESILLGIKGLGHVEDASACTYFCLASLEFKWGLFKLYTPLIWIWWVAVVIVILKHGDDKIIDPLELFPYYLALTYMLAVVILDFKRAVYPFYYAPLTLLVVFPLKDLFVHLRSALIYKSLVRYVWGTACQKQSSDPRPFQT
jgi:hypothetical protein